MKIFLILIITITFNLGKDYKELIPYYKGGKWGLCNIDKEIIVQPVYDNINMLFHGCASATMDGKQALINIDSGQLLSNFEYDDISEFILATHYPCPPYFKIVKETKKGIIDTSGNIIIPAIYDDIETFTCYENKIFVATKDNKKLILKRDGTIISKNEYDEIRDPFDCGNIIGAKLNEKIGFVNIITGEEVTEFKYDFSGYMGMVTSYSDNHKPVELDKHFGTINNKGKEIIPTEYDDIQFISKNIFIVKKDGKIGGVDSCNKHIIPFEFKEFSYWSSLDVSNYPEMFILKKDGKEYYFDSTAKQVSLSEYDKTEYIPYIKCFIAKRNDAYGIVDINDSIIIPFEYDEIRCRSFSKYPVFSIYKDGKVGLINSRNWNIIKPKYDKIEEEGVGPIRVELNNKVGFIDSLDNTIIPFIYDHAYRSFSNGCIEVGIGNKWGVINNKGEEVIPIIYDKVYIHELPCIEVSQNEKTAFFDIKEKKLSSFKNYKIRYPNEGDSTFTIVEKNGKEGIIDIKGNEILSPIYDGIQYSNHPVYHVEKNGKRFYVKAGDIQFYDD